jgi:hypothetical protein
VERLDPQPRKAIHCGERVDRTAPYLQLEVEPRPAVAAELRYFRQLRHREAGKRFQLAVRQLRQRLVSDGVIVEAGQSAVSKAVDVALDHVGSLAERCRKCRQRVVGVAGCRATAVGDELHRAGCARF